MEGLKPILFNTEMVRAILDGRKTMTRRIAGDNFNKAKSFTSNANGTKWLCKIDIGNDEIWATEKAQYKKGNILYVRETFCIGTYDEDDSSHKEHWNIQQYEDSSSIFYKADTYDGRYSDPDNEAKWKPSIHMPKKYARIFLKVIDVKVERLQDITREDIHKEGIKILPPKDGYHSIFTFGGKEFNEPFPAWIELWNSTAKDGFKWEDNPLVFVNSFERIEV